MKTIKRTNIIISVVAFTALLIVGYSLSALNPMGMFDFFGNTDESDISSWDIYNARDLSSSFNERGYLNSNSGSVDGQEIINDYNGNLMYKIPISKAKGQGDLYYDFSLNYNGNVNYQVIACGQTGTNWLSGVVHQYNISAPGWIFNLNGLAVQMINFESSYFTVPDYVNKEAKGRYVRLLATGYQLTDLLTTPTEQNPDKITIMLGDGSTEVLENSTGGLNDYTGWYKSTTKNSFMKGFVRYQNGVDSSGISDPTNPAGAPRIMYLMKGDGLTYIYEEKDIKYLDHEKVYGMAGWFRPLTFIMTKIKDRFGHVYNLDYKYNINGTNWHIGRPWLASYPGGIFLYDGLWDSYVRIRVNSLDGYYSIYTESFGVLSELNHRPNITKIIRPSGETMSFLYERYGRKGTHMYNTNTGDPDMSVIMSFGNDGLYRLKKVTGFDGGIRDYLYETPGTTLEMNYQLASLESYIHSPMYQYKGQGRDYFFANMIGSASVQTGDDFIRKDTIIYSYYYGQRDTTDVWQHPMDERDTMVSRRVTIAGSGSDYNYNTPTQHGARRVYRNFRTKEIQSGWQTADFEGQMKMTMEEYFTSAGTHKMVNHGYHFGTLNQYSVYTGTFLDSLLQENYNGVTRRWLYSYTGGGNVPITEKIETDPLDRVTTTKDSVFEKYNYQVFLDGIFSQSMGLHYDEAFLYLINMPYEIITTKNSTLLQKKMVQYYNPDVDFTDTTKQADGYPGQVALEINVDPQNQNNTQIVSYKYYNHDTTSKALFLSLGAFFGNSIEGNISELTDARNNKTKYYYYPISWDEDITYDPDSLGQQGDQIDSFLNVSYHVLRENQDVVYKSWWTDKRFPTRIDQYVNQGYYISNYQQYNEIGNPRIILNPSKYASQFDYGFNYRLARATLPYDFDTQNPQYIEIIDSTITPVEIFSNSIGWGHSDEVNYAHYHYTEDVQFANYLLIDIDVESSGGSDVINRWYVGTMKIDNSGFTGISEVDSAFVEFAPLYLYCKTDGNYSNDYSFRIKPLDHINNDSISLGTGSQTYGTLTCSDSIDCENFDTVQVYTNNYQKLDITDILNDNIVEESGVKKLNVAGLQFDMRGPVYTICDHYEMKAVFKGCGVTVAHWNQLARPKVTIYAKKTTYDTTRITKYYSGTLIYDYDDFADSIMVQSKIDKPGVDYRFKKSTHYFDDFGKLKQSKLYTIGGNSSSSFTYYNYLDQKGKTIGPRGDSVRYSYNAYGSLARTDNTDNSYTLDTIIYYGGLTTHWGRLDCLISEQVYKDELGYEFKKHYDAAGNLRKEIKYVTEGLNDVALTTEYKYDDLDRVTEVYTPNGKSIYYTYDEFGRQSSRETPDAGKIQYKYDDNNNLRFSQDDNQLNAVNPKFITFRGYDALNRLLYIGEADRDDRVYTWSTLDGDVTQQFESYNPDSSNFLTINVYDTLINAFAGIFTAPGNYYDVPNYTKGALVATAYRTRHTDNWNYKYYRYDPRGRVKKMWHYIDGLGWKGIEYSYNSQNQVTYVTYMLNSSSPDFNQYNYTYDDAGRLKDVNVFKDDHTGLTNFGTYTYNENSQVLELAYNSDAFNVGYDYTNRNWLEHIVSGELFVYYPGYYFNGNVENVYISGTYNNNFGNTDDLSFDYTYDKSNRLLGVNNTVTQDNTYDMSMNYDYDGNILTMQRYGDNNTLVDGFYYQYFTGTNRLKQVLYNDDYTYDYNGNLTEDHFSGKYPMIYDHRNLLIEVTSDYTENSVLKTRYYYDEAGNRIKKYVLRSTMSDPDPPNWDGGDELGDGWVIFSIEYYVRDVNGKEIAIYDYTDIEMWNVWGLDNTGKVNSDRSRFFYIKDHLGSIRVAVDTNGSVVYAQDYDCWGYPLMARNYESVAGDKTNKYRFTSKERDKETIGSDFMNVGYDYFGARYYNSRIGNWTSIDPLFEKHFDYSPYNYVLRNPIALVDPDGRQIKFSDNKLTREREISIIKATQSAEMREYIEAIPNTNGDFILDAELLKSGNEKFPTELSSRLLDIAQRSITTELKSVIPHDKIKVLTSNGSEGSFTLGEKNVWAATIPSGTVEGQEDIGYRSKSGNVEIYYDYTPSSEGVASVIGHELYTHVWNYITGNDWIHGYEFNKEDKYIQGLVDENVNQK